VSEKRNLWSSKSRERTILLGHRPNQHVTVFRSDADLHQWRYEWAMMSAATAMSFAFLEVWDISFRYSFVGFSPALLIVIASRVIARRNRKLGRRAPFHGDTNG